MDTHEIVSRDEYLIFGDYTSEDGQYLFSKTSITDRALMGQYSEDNLTHCLLFTSSKGATIQIDLDAMGWFTVKVNDQLYTDVEDGRTEFCETEKIAQPLRGLVEQALIWCQNLYFKAHREAQSKPTYDPAADQIERERLKKQGQNLLDAL